MSTAAGVDGARLLAWMDRRGIGDGPITSLAPVGGGSQNVLVDVRRGDRHLVLRRPPLQPRPGSAETVRREARIMEALGRTTVPHPQLVGYEPDTSTLGVPFLLMEHVDGFSPWSGLPDPHRGDHRTQHAMGLALVDGFAQLALVDLDEVGLSDVGHPQGWLARQTARWRRQLDGYGQHDLPDTDAVCAWLDARVPAPVRPALLHGDAHAGNVLVSTGGPELAAILDWELATVGDPRLDLGQLLATWGDAGSVYEARWDAPGLPTPTQIVAHYAARTSLDVSEVRWFHVLACLRLGILLESTWVRALQGKAPREIGEVLHDRAVRLVARARALCDEQD
jgi:aminoglycoside phosphotransferase (APT) family kinase protein